MLAETQMREFQEAVWNYFRLHRRDMPWREDPTPYHVLVSEMMLQQTQVSRVLPKYHSFIERFPGVTELAKASLADVLREWSGLGYNRRAKFLHRAAQKAMTDFGGTIPSTHKALISLPGVGSNTAGAIRAYAFNQPAVFIETNIRTVFFHHFFADAVGVHDRELLPMVEQTLDREHPREWYWALMDYGAHLKQTQSSNISQSKHYVRQSKFEGSRRQVRGKVLRELLEGPNLVSRLAAYVGDSRLHGVIDDLVAEGFVERQGDSIRLTGGTKLP